MMKLKLVGLLLMVAVCATVVNSQYFSSHDGINLPRNGKRSSPLTNIVSYRKLTKPNPLSSSLYNLHTPISFDRVYHQDKLSFRKYLKKFGKRFVIDPFDDDEYNNVELDLVKSANMNNDKMIRNLIIDYLADKRVPIIVEMDDDSSLSPSEEINNNFNSEEKK